MSIIKDNKFIKENIFIGRNSEWFSNLQGKGGKDEYDYFPSNWGIPKKAPKEIREDFDKANDYGYYDFHYIVAGAFCEWFNKYRPDLEAGWVSTYDKWRMEKKGYTPENPQHCLEPEDRIDDMHFVEYQDKYDCSLWLYNYLIDNEIYADAVIVYYFNC